MYGCGHLVDWFVDEGDVDDAPFQRPFAADTETNSTIRVILISARL